MQIMPTVSQNRNPIQAALSSAIANQHTIAFSDFFNPNTLSAQSQAEAYEYQETGLSEQQLATLTLPKQTEENQSEDNQDIEELTEEKKKENVYSKHTTDGYTYTLEEVCFTQEEIKTLYNSLVEKGAPKTSLEKLQKLAELPGGANLGQVMTALKGQKEIPELSDEDANNIVSLSESIDPTGVLSEKILNALYNQKPLEALRELTKALDTLDANEIINISKQDLVSFGNGLGVSESAKTKIETLFGEKENVSIPVAQMKKLLAPIQEELFSEKSKQQSLDAALDKTLQPLLTKARKRMEQEQSASNEKNRNAMHSQVVIDKTVQQESRQTIDKIFDAMHEKVQENMQDRKTFDVMRDVDNLDDLQHFGISQIDIARMKEGSLGGNTQNGDSKQNAKNWKELTGKIRVEGNKNIPFTMHNTFTTNASFAQNMELSMLHTRQNIPLPQQVGHQVETGFVSLLQNGATRLDLQLHPQELGSLTITLISHNGEINAHIRADKSETVEMLHRQAESIKLSLEQQGIKIDNIEIELQENKNHANDGQQFFDTMQQRNTFQEENARRDQLRRLKNLASVGALENSSKVEQNMQADEQTNTSATRILDRVA